MEPGVGQNIVMHALFSARDFYLKLISTLCPFTFISFSQKKKKKISGVFPVLAVAYAGSCVGPQNKLGPPARCHRQLMQVPVFECPRNMKRLQTCVTVVIFV